MIEFTEEELTILAEAYIYHNGEFTRFIHLNHHPILRTKNAFTYGISPTAWNETAGYITMGWFLNTMEHPQLKRLVDALELL